MSNPAHQRPDDGAALRRDRALAAAVEGGEERRQGEVGRHPAERHADPADEAELAEAAEVRDRQRQVGDARPEGRDERGGERATPGDLHRLLEADPAPPLLQEARHHDDGDVDAVPHDDRAEEGGVGIEVADEEPGEAERRRAADGERAQDGEDGGPAPEVGVEHGQHEHQHHHRGRDEVGLQRRLLLHQRGHLAVVADADGRVVALRLERFDLGLHRFEDALVGAEAGGRLRGPHQHDEELAVWRLEVALPELLQRARHRAVFLLEVGEVERGRRPELILTQQIVERVRLLLLPGDAPIEAPLDDAEVVGGDVEATEAPEEGLLLVGPVLDPLHQVAGQHAQPLRHVVGEPLQRVAVAALEDHREVRHVVELLRHRPRRLHARRGVGEELLEPGSQVRVELHAEERAEDEDHGGEAEHDPAAPDEPGHQGAADRSRLARGPAPATPCPGPGALERSPIVHLSARTRPSGTPASGSSRQPSLEER